MDRVRVDADTELSEAECRSCGEDFKWLQVHSDQMPPHECLACSRGKVKEEERQEIEARTTQSDVPWILTALRKVGVNIDEFGDATLESFDSTHDRRALACTATYLQAVARRDRGRPWLYLAGPAGNGKTHLAVAGLRDLIEEKVIPTAGACFVNAEMLLLQLEESYDKGEGESAYRLIKRYADYEVLVVDDLGVRGFEREHPRRMFYLLADQRCGRPTIWTSNMTAEHMVQEHPDMDRLVSRIRGQCGDRYQLVLEGPDRRNPSAEA